MDGDKANAMAENTINESPIRALVVVLVVAVVCALLVSVSVVKLRPNYVANLEAHRMAQLESILSALSKTPYAVATKNIESRVVELDSGRYSKRLDAATFDALKAAANADESILIPPDRDIAGIKRREKHATVFLVRDAKGAVELMILPVRGSGYQDTDHAKCRLREVMALRSLSGGVILRQLAA